MTNTEIAQQVATAHPARVANKNGSRPARVADVQKAAKAAAAKLGLTGREYNLFYLAATKTALGREDISTAGFGR